MLSDDFSAESGGTSSTQGALSGSPVTLHLQVPDVDAAWERAVAAGAVVTMPLANQFRYGQLKDPFGHKWSMRQNNISLNKVGIKEAVKTSLKR